MQAVFGQGLALRFDCTVTSNGSNHERNEWQATTKHDHITHYQISYTTDDGTLEKTCHCSNPRLSCTQHHTHCGQAHQEAAAAAAAAAGCRQQAAGSASGPLFTVFDSLQ